MSPSLPYEIIDRFASELALAYHSPSPQPTTSPSPSLLPTVGPKRDPTICKLLLVNSAWCNVARKHLFSSITISRLHALKKPDHLETLLDLLGCAEDEGLSEPLAATPNSSSSSSSDSSSTSGFQSDSEDSATTTILAPFISLVRHLTIDYPGPDQDESATFLNSPTLARLLHRFLHPSAHLNSFHLTGGSDSTSFGALPVPFRLIKPEAQEAMRRLCSEGKFIQEVSMTYVLSIPWGFLKGTKAEKVVIETATTAMGSMDQTTLEKLPNPWLLSPEEFLVQDIQNYAICQEVGPPPSALRSVKLNSFDCALGRVSMRHAVAMILGCPVTSSFPGIRSLSVGHRESSHVQSLLDACPRLKNLELDIILDPVSDTTTKPILDLRALTRLTSLRFQASFFLRRSPPPSLSGTTLVGCLAQLRALRSVFDSLPNPAWLEHLEFTLKVVFGRPEIPGIRIPMANPVLASDESRLSDVQLKMLHIWADITNRLNDVGTGNAKGGVNLTLVIVDRFNERSGLSAGGAAGRVRTGRVWEMELLDAFVQQAKGCSRVDIRVVEQ